MSSILGGSIYHSRHVKPLDDPAGNHGAVDRPPDTAKITPHISFGAHMSSSRLSRGFSMGGFLMLLALSLVLGLLGMKIVPMYMEYNSVKGAMNAISAEKFDSNKAVREALMKRMSVNYVESVKREDISITTSDGAYLVVVDYYVDKSLFANLSISGHFQHEVTTAK